MKFENPFEKKNLVLDTNLKIKSLDNEKLEITLTANANQNFTIKSEYLNPNNISLEMGDEFEFGSKSDIIGGSSFQLKHLKSGKVISFHNYTFN
ncbi:hypothetical protein ACSV4D_12355 [Flavobacterium sp. ARAG 55.4]|uniref:hypothetical protein n=1 Tax=Flavobacterium sp. ARAG 55.4 TaxID=3451357 RepID=UPI003F478EA6